MIPKIINYIWLSDEEPEHLIKNCLLSWEKNAPDYKIVKWTMKDFDFSKMPSWVNEAISAKKWAFACDYLRLYVLYYFGGFYLDSDVLILHSPDEFLNHGFVSSVEYFEEVFIKFKKYIDEDGNPLSPGILGLTIQAAIMGCEAFHPLVYDCMRFYENNHFILEDGSYNESVLAPMHIAECAVKYGFKYKNINQKLSNNIYIYQSDIFAPGFAQSNKNSFMIHLCFGSWRKLSEDIRKKYLINTEINYYKSLSFSGKLSSFLKYYPIFCILVINKKCQTLIKILKSSINI